MLSFLHQVWTSGSDCRHQCFRIGSGMAFSGSLLNQFKFPDLQWWVLRWLIGVLLLKVSNSSFRLLHLFLLLSNSSLLHVCSSSLVASSCLSGNRLPYLPVLAKALFSNTPPQIVSFLYRSAFSVDRRCFSWFGPEILFFKFDLRSAVQPYWSAEWSWMLYQRFLSIWFLIWIPSFEVDSLLDFCLINCICANSNAKPSLAILIILCVAFLAAVGEKVWCHRECERFHMLIHHHTCSAI